MTVNFDVVVQHVGEYGTYQKLIFYLLCIPAALPAAWSSFYQVFVSATPSHWCWIPELSNLSIIVRKSIGIPKAENGAYSKCSMYNVNFTKLFLENNNQWPNLTNHQWPTTACKYGWEYDRLEYLSTLVTKWNLVCEDSWRPTTATSAFYFGNLIGTILFGSVSDRWGRKVAFTILIIVLVLLTTFSAFSINYDMYTALRAFAGICFPCIYQIPFVLGIEFMGPNQRTYAGIIMSVIYAFALSLLPLLAYILKDWFPLILWSSVPFILLVSYWWIIPESPRWLMSKNRLQEAEIIIQKMAKVNKKIIPKNLIFELEKSNVEPDEVYNKKNIDANIADLFRYPNIRKKFLIIVFNWVTNSLVYNGLNYNTANLGVSDYLAFFIGAIIEVPAYLLVWWLMNHHGRKWTLSSSMFVGGLACILSLIISKGWFVFEICINNYIVKKTHG